jgi:hypothetical protein
VGPKISLSLWRPVFYTPAVRLPKFRPGDLLRRALPSSTPSSPPSSPRRRYVPLSLFLPSSTSIALGHAAAAVHAPPPRACKNPRAHVSAESEREGEERRGKEKREEGEGREGREREERGKREEGGREREKREEGEGRERREEKREERREGKGREE